MSAVSGILTQPPTQAASHRAASTTTGPYRPSSRRPRRSTPPGGDHHVHLPKVPRRTTPNLLRAGGALIGGLALIAAVVTAGYASSVHSRLDSLDHVDAPSVHATSDFLFQVEDMDAQLANALLISGDTSLTTSRATSMQHYEDDRRQAEADLENATAALAGDPKKLADLSAVAHLFGTYQEDATRAVQLDEQANVTKAGTAPANVLAAYQNGADFLAGRNGQGTDPGSLVAQARALDTGSTDAIGQSAQQTQDALDTVTVCVIVIGALPLVALVFVQLRMSRKFHRRFNRPLAAATVVTAILMVSGLVAFQSASDDLHNGKANAFDSIQKLTLAKATSYDANADESRWLLDQVHAAFYEQTFLSKAKRIADTSADAPDDASTRDATPADVAAYEHSIGDVSSALTAYPGSPVGTLFSSASAFGFEFGNITFPGEDDAARAAFTAYSSYLQGDAKIRQYSLTDPKSLHDAIDFDTNATTPGTSDQTFNDYSQKLDDVIALNQSQFDASMASAISGAGTWTWLPYVFLLLIAGLTVLGIRPRLREYQ